eukprot:4467246-Pyramimonas_sp.AAC.2
MTAMGDSATVSEEGEASSPKTAPFGDAPRQVAQTRTRCCWTVAGSRSSPGCSTVCRPLYAQMGNECGRGPVVATFRTLGRAPTW